MSARTIATNREEPLSRVIAEVCNKSEDLRGYRHHGRALWQPNCFKLFVIAEVFGNADMYQNLCADLS